MRCGCRLEASSVSFMAREHWFSLSVESLDAQPESSRTLEVTISASRHGRLNIARSLGSYSGLSRKTGQDSSLVHETRVTPRRYSLIGSPLLLHPQAIVSVNAEHL